MRTLFIPILFFISFLASAQIDQAGSGRAISLDGVNDYIDYGDRYHDLNVPFTVSAWVYLDPGVNQANPVFVTGHNTFAYRGFWFYVSHINMSCEVGDGFGGNNPAFRRGKIASIPNISGRWNHICAVMRSPTDVDLFINGINVGGSPSGSSGQGMANSIAGDRAMSGFQNANEVVVYRMKGMIDDVRLWNRALTETEVRTMMCKKLTGNEPGLIGYWNFDEVSGTTIQDKSTKAFHGELINGATRVFSGAPIGDESIYQYNSSWAGKTITQTKGDETVTVTNISGDPEGVHLYTVNSQPSQTGGLDAPANTYFGVYTAAMDVNNSFTVAHTSNNQGCGVAIRRDNSVSVWNETPSTVTNVSLRTELIKKPSQSQLTIDLGDDILICPMNTTVLQPLQNPTGYSFKWQDGSKQSTYTATEYGTYWVTVEKDCSVDTDTIHITKPEFAKVTLPNVFSPNEDQWNQFFTIQDDLLGSQLYVYNRWGKLVYSSLNYQNDWSGSNLPVGVYYFLITGACIQEQKSWVSIVR